MDKQTVAAILYDFDKTLSPKSMQEYAFMDGVGVSSAAFWEECDRLAHQNQMDQILAYMYVMVQKSRGKMLLNREEFKKLGKSVQLFDGVKDWFRRVNAFGQKLGLQVEHYIISSGLKEIIEGTSIAGKFTPLSFCMTATACPCGPPWRSTIPAKLSFYSASIKTCWMLMMIKGSTALCRRISAGYPSATWYMWATALPMCPV